MFLNGQSSNISRSKPIQFFKNGKWEGYIEYFEEKNVFGLRKYEQKNRNYFENYIYYKNLLFVYHIIETKARSIGGFIKALNEAFTSVLQKIAFYII